MYVHKVATAQGKREIRCSFFHTGETPGIYLKLYNMFLHREFTLTQKM